MQWTAAVSFESDTQPVKTWRGVIQAVGVQTAISRAVKAAKLEFPRAAYRSVVAVVEKDR